MADHRESEETVSPAEKRINRLAEVISLYGREIARYSAFCLMKYGSQLVNPNIIDEVLSDVIDEASRLARIEARAFPPTTDEMVPWLKRITTFKVLEYVRNFAKRHQLVQSMSPEELDLLEAHPIVDYIDRHGAFQELVTSCKRLSDVEQEVVRLYFEDHMTSDEIAGILQKSPASVRKIKQRALQKLRRHLERRSA